METELAKAIVYIGAAMIWAVAGVMWLISGFVNIKVARVSLKHETEKLEAFRKMHARIAEITEHTQATMMKH